MMHCHILFSTQCFAKYFSSYSELNQSIGINEYKTCTNVVSHAFTFLYSVTFMYRLVLKISFHSNAYSCNSSYTFA